MPRAALSLIERWSFGFGPFSRFVFTIPFQMPIEQILISTQQKRSRPAGRIENPQALRLLRGFAFEEFAYGIFYDILNDVSGRVKDAASFFDFGLILHDGAVITGQANDLA